MEVPDLKTLTELIAMNSEDIKIVESKLKSPVWINFNQIFYKTININYAQCKSCRTLIKRDGTSGMNRHVCNKIVPANQSMMSSYVKRKFPPKHQEKLGKY